jgi:hypothetical protein
MQRRSFLLLGASAARAARRPEKLTIRDTPGTESRFLLGSRLLFSCRYSAARPKPYVHPLCAPDGSVVTQDGPGDHVHHRGLMLAWSGVDGIDFWGEVNPARHGAIVHRSFGKPPRRGLSSFIEWNAEGRLLLTETRTITAPEQSSDETLLDWASVLQAPDGVRLGTAGHTYNGLGVRVAASMDLGAVLNSNGTTEIKKANGEAAAWCAYSGKLGSGLAGIAIFDHSANPRHPSPYFVMNDKFGYMSAAPTFRQDFVLEKGQELRFRWRVAVWNGVRGRDAIDRMYRAWAGAPR